MESSHGPINNVISCGTSINVCPWNLRCDPLPQLRLNTVFWKTEDFWPGMDVYLDRRAGNLAQRHPDERCDRVLHDLPDPSHADCGPLPAEVRERVCEVSARVLRVLCMKLEIVPRCCCRQSGATMFSERPDQRANERAAVGRRHRGPLATDTASVSRSSKRGIRARTALRPAVSRISWSLAIAIATAGLATLSCCDTDVIPVLRCPLYAATHIHCPVCGVTRATHALLHGRFLEAMRFNALWVVSIPLLLYIAVSETWFSFGGSGPCFWSPAQHPWFYIVAMMIVGLFFLLRNLPWYPMVLLAPPGI